MKCHDTLLIYVHASNLSPLLPQSGPYSILYLFSKNISVLPVMAFDLFCHYMTICSLCVHSNIIWFDLFSDMIEDRSTTSFEPTMYTAKNLRFNFVSSLENYDQFQKDFTAFSFLFFRAILKRKFHDPMYLKP